MNKLVEKIGGKEYILLSYPFRSKWKGERFERRCLDLNGIIQGASTNAAQNLVTINVLLPVERIEEFKRLEAEDAEESGNGLTISQIYKSGFIGMLVAFLVLGALYSLYLIFIGSL